jgi:hypothetical protein
MSSNSDSGSSQESRPAHGAPDDHSETPPIPTSPSGLFELLDIDNPRAAAADENGFSVDVGWQDVETPEAVSKTAKEAEIDFAERILEYAISHEDFGHHRKLSESITDFANDHRDDDATPDFWRQRAYQLGPSQLNMGRIVAEEDCDDPDVPADGPTTSQYEKARLIIAWAGTVFPTQKLHALEKELAAGQANRWADAYEETVDRKEAAAFLADLPDEHNGWSRLPSPAEAIAYAGPPTDQSGTVKTDTDADGEFILLFLGDGYHRLFTLDFDEYHRINPATVDSIDTHEIKCHRRDRVGNPESWTDGARQLLDHINGASWPDETDSTATNHTENYD